MTLRDTVEGITLTRPVDRVWAERKFAGYYHRYTSDATVGQRFGELCVEVADRIRAGTTGRLSGDAALDQSYDLMEGIVTGRYGPSDLQKRYGMGMALPLLLHRLTGGHREAYYRLLETMPEQNDYAPTYITMGPTGKCNVVCPDCIIGGAIFRKDRQALHKTEDVLPYLDDAEASGVTSVSFCIGEPTYNIPLLFRAFDRIRESPVLQPRSLVTNALFARRYEKAVAFLEGFAEHLGPEKSRTCMIGVSLNDDLNEVGVPISATANLICAFSQVFPGHRLVVQLIMDEGFHRIQNALFSELGARGVLENAEGLQLTKEGCHPELVLTNGTRVLMSVMRKQPSLHNPWARADGDLPAAEDPWVRYLAPEALHEAPVKGLYTYEGGEDSDETEGGLVVHRITVGPDGILYPDYHFMVSGTRPLGARIADAIQSFRRDPVLGLLLRRGGLNALLSTYHAIPAEERLIEDLYEPTLSCSTAGMAAANVLFGDYEVAGELAVRLMTNGVTLPEGILTHVLDRHRPQRDQRG